MPSPEEMAKLAEKMPGGSAAGNAEFAARHFRADCRAWRSEIATGISGVWKEEMNDAQIEESYARSAAFTASERSAVREKVVRRAFKLGVLATFGMFLLWVAVPNAYSIWTILLAIPLIAGLSYSLAWLILRTKRE